MNVRESYSCAFQQVTLSSSLPDIRGGIKLDVQVCSSDSVPLSFTGMGREGILFPPILENEENDFQWEFDRHFPRFLQF